ncbi:hypothetical protein TNCV_1397071 [Trichonephila clavipes]|nr:hypothetical protein TNCV_1397071 [Trichonephila clavipes]
METSLFRGATGAAAMMMRDQEKKSVRKIPLLFKKVKREVAALKNAAQKMVWIRLRSAKTSQKTIAKICGFRTRQIK